MKPIKNVPQKIAVQTFHQKWLYCLPRLPLVLASKQPLITGKYISVGDFLKLIMLSFYFIIEEILYAFHIMQSKMTNTFFLLLKTGCQSALFLNSNKAY
jgi:hypothetical protein